MGLSQWEGVLIPSKPFSIGAIPLNHSTLQTRKKQKTAQCSLPIDWKNGKKKQQPVLTHLLVKTMEKWEKNNHSLLTQ